MDSNESRWRVPSTIWLLIFFVGLLYFLNVFQIEEYYTYPTPGRSEKFYAKESLKGFLVKTKGCRIPYMHPMDKTITKYIFKYDPPVCNNGIPSLYESNFTSLYLVNSSLPHYNLTDTKDLKCCYQEVSRRDVKGPKDNDNSFFTNKTCTNIGESTNIDKNYILITCRVNKHVIYTDMFWFVPSKVNNKTEMINDVTPPLNVLMVGLDAVSRLNLHRQMPKTVAYLTQIDAVEMLGYNKVGDNTFPNLIPVLSGLTEGELKDSCWHGKHFDNCTFLWNMFKNKGYMTSFGEDSSWMGLFNYMRHGFSRQPTDYAYGYFNRISEQKVGNAHSMNVDQCIGSREVYKDFLEYIGSVTRRFRMDNTPYFAFYWGASLSHDYLNKPSTGDESYLEFFRSLYEDGYLDNTVLVFMSDHGIRWGSIRQTYQGRMEERLPFVFVRLPDDYKKHHPQIYNNLKVNSHKLTTPFDLHETMADLLDPYSLTSDNIHSRNDTNDRGISLFSQIPDTRTCETAAIDAHWCTCQQSQEVAEDDPKVLEAAAFVVRRMNSLLKDLTECANLTLDAVLNARVMSHADAITNKKHEFEDYMITVRTAPGEGVFESTVRRVLEGTAHEIMGTISRLNLYGKQSKCITDFHLKLYCYCKSLFF
ncbi:unnamed protein product [Brassicogethes aeneus]|uniref:DUF229 domain containing protein n=1 Tax=Brassicogethes aeneus TaxID=1431903 RepID=A0A9P0FI29_BRAAE|nr:unnamed protein product [Brassicogethes aeneus]